MLDIDSDANLILSKLKDRRDLCVESLNSISGFSLSSPESTFYLYVNVSEPMKNKGYDDIDKFRIDALRDTGVSFCTRNHFGTPMVGEDEQYIRLAYSGISKIEIQEGLSLFKDWIEN
jgi:aspartate/methionine/tyrosine aminotransferase